MDVFVEIPNQTFEAEIRIKGHLGHWSSDCPSIRRPLTYKTLNLTLFLFTGPEEMWLIVSTDGKFETFICTVLASGSH